MRLPPYGKPLAARLRFRNRPLFVPVCVGMDDWPRAKAWNDGPNDTPALILPPQVDPRSLSWPVVGCHCIVEWDTGPSKETIVMLIQALLRDGAALVNTRPLFTDYSRNLWVYETETGKRIQVQEIPLAFTGRRSDVAA